MANHHRNTNQNYHEIAPHICQNGYYQKDNRGLLCLILPQGLHEEGSGTPLQHSRLDNPMDGGAWWAAVHEVAKSQT